MYDITLVCTHHRQLGKCNSDELYKILEHLNPEVIFDELPSGSFDKYYGDSSDIYHINSFLENGHLPEELLEVKCIKKYRRNHIIEIIPVDFAETHKPSKHQAEIFSMALLFFKNKDYETLDHDNDTLIAQEGFDYLNSDKLLEFLAKKEVLEIEIMDSNIQKNRLLDVYKLFHAEEYDNRENAMLTNIYNYSKENRYNQAVFLIGAGHIRSIMQKISEYEELSEIKLNWTKYANK